MISTHQYNCERLVIWLCSSQFHLSTFGLARWTSFRKYFDTPYRILDKICFLSFLESRIAMKQHSPTRLWSKDMFLKFCVSWVESGQSRFRTNRTNSSANEFFVFAKYLKFKSVPNSPDFRFIAIWNLDELPVKKLRKFMKFSIGQFCGMMKLNEMKQRFRKVGFAHYYTQVASKDTYILTYFNSIHSKASSKMLLREI